MMRAEGSRALRHALSRLEDPSEAVEIFCKTLDDGRSSEDGSARQIIEDAETIRSLVDQVFWLEVLDVDER